MGIPREGKANDVIISPNNYDSSISNYKFKPMNKLNFNGVNVIGGEVILYEDITCDLHKVSVSGL